MNTPQKLGLSATLAVLVLVAGLALRLAGPEALEREPGLAPEARAAASEPDALPLEEIGGPPAPAVEVSVPEAPARELQEAGPAPRGLPAHGIYGRVTRSDGTPLPGCLVTARLHGQVFTTRSDAEGSYALEVDWGRRDGEALEVSEEVARALEALGYAARNQRDTTRRNPYEYVLHSSSPRRPALRVTARDPLGFEGERGIDMGSGTPARLRVDITVDDRPRVTGVVHGILGPEPGVDLSLFDDAWRLLGTARSDLDGRFCLGAPEPGTYRLHARKPGAGTAAEAGTYLGVGASRLEHQLALGGDGLLRGRVVLGDGEPVVGVELTAVASALALDALPRPTWPGMSQLARFEEHRGLAHTRVRTDRGGVFAMAGMQEVDYMLFFEGLPANLQPEGIYRTGGEHVIEFRARLLRVELEGLSPEQRRWLRVHFVERERRSSDGEPRHVVLPGGPQPPTLAVESGSRWTIRWAWGARSGRPVEVRVADDELVTLVALHADARDLDRSFDEEERPVEGRARLDVVLRGPGGARVDAAVSLWRVEDGGLQRLFTQRVCGEHRSLPALEPGVYAYRVEASRGAEWSFVGRGEGRIELVAAVERSLELELEPAGALEIELVRPPGAQAFPASCRLRLKWGNAEQRWLEFRTESGLPRASLSPGQRARAVRPVPKGKCLVEAFAEGRRRGRAWVEVESGGLTRLRLELDG